MRDDYPCISRCVRWCWLCGFDDFTQRSYEHRREWIETRLVHLAEQFALDLLSYSVMSNHYHIVVHVEPERVAQWSDEDIVERWLQIAPIKDEKKAQKRREWLLSSPDEIAELRHRLGSLSWFMSSMNTPIARWANQEDGCKGRFWEGRFRSIALLDEEAVRDCVAYVDLNPARAKMAERVEDLAHTAIARRIRAETAGEPSGLARLDTIGFTLADYRALLEWTIDFERDRKVHRPTSPATRVLKHLKREPSEWLYEVGLHRFAYRAYGAYNKVQALAKRLGQHWICGWKSMRGAPG